MRNLSRRSFNSLFATVYRNRGSTFAQICCLCHWKSNKKNIIIKVIKWQYFILSQSISLVFWTGSHWVVGNHFQWLFFRICSGFWEQKQLLLFRSFLTISILSFWGWNLFVYLLCGNNWWYRMESHFNVQLKGMKGVIWTLFVNDFSPSFVISTPI